MSEALLPTVARPEITRPGGAVMLPAVIVYAGPAANRFHDVGDAQRIIVAGQAIPWPDPRRVRCHPGASHRCQSPHHRAGPGSPATRHRTGCWPPRVP